MAKIITTEFVNSLPDDPKISLFIITQTAISKCGADFECVLSAYVFLEEFIQSRLITVELPKPPEITTDREVSKNNILGYFAVIKDAHIEYYKEKQLEHKIQALRKEAKQELNSIFLYEFSDNEIESIQSLLNDLRVKINESDLFEDDHKRRLLIRLEKLQSELHKSVSDLDKFWGLVGDAGTAIGKFGENAKPFVDLIKDITNIIWKAQARSEKLSDDTPPKLFYDDDE